MMHYCFQYCFGLNKIILRIGLLIAGLFLTGCVHALHPYNAPSHEKLRLLTSVPKNYSVLVASKGYYSVPDEARVTIYIPRLPRGCATYLLGVRISDVSCYNVPAIYIKEGRRTVLKMSLNQLHKLPVDKEGFYSVPVTKVK